MTTKPRFGTIHPGSALFNSLLQFLQTVAELVAGQAQELGRMGLVAARSPQCLLQKRRLYFVQANPVARKADGTIHVYYAWTRAPGVLRPVWHPAAR
jgi:hypothetical protein